MEQAAKANDNFIEALEAMGNRLRIHSIVSTAAAGSGHPSSCMSAADLVAAIFFHAMRYDVSDPKSPINDRFVLSKGHAAPLLYAALAEAGAFPVEELTNLRKFTSPLEGHPTPRLPWVDVATGSLGQGLSAGVGLALASRFLDHVKNKIFVLLGDGECAEGSVWEAAQLASYYKLNNLIAIVDVNGLGQSQATMYEHQTNVYFRRFEAFGWQAAEIDGHNMAQVVTILDDAARDREQPFAIIAATAKGKGVSFMEGLEGWHGKAFKQGEEADRAIAELIPKTEKYVMMEVRKPEGRAMHAVAAVDASPDPFAYKPGEEKATREVYGAALARLGKSNNLIVALDGDTKNSTYSEKFMKAFPDRFFECFIAEQNMVGAAVGLAASGKVPFASTFACFLTRAYDQIRMAAISQANLKLCGSHAGVSIGEDGPSQMALEDLAMMRAIEESMVLYPSDAVATERAVEIAAGVKGIVYIRTSRPKTPVIYQNDETFELGRAKVVRQSDKDQLTIVAGGVTLFEALAAHDELQAKGIAVRVIDIFSVKPIDDETLTEAGKATNNLILTVEDHSICGGIGEAVAAAVSPVGIRVHMLAVTEVPRSGKGEELLAAYQIDRKAIVAMVKELLERQN